MAKLPTVASMGRRPAPGAPRGVATISTQAITAPGRALEGFGDTMTGIGEQMYDREQTAAAKERDALVSDQIRDLLYNPESGFTSLNGGAAVNARETTIERLNRLQEGAMEGLSNVAQRKLQDQLTRRIDSAMQTVEVHTGGQRDAWINGAAQARIESARQDSLFSPDQTAAALNTIESEIRGIAAREGWASEKTELELENARSQVFTDQIERIASRDPIQAMEHLRANQGSMTASDVANAEAKLQPEIKNALGRAQGRDAYVGVGNLDAAFTTAQATIGLNENDQRAAIQEYLKDGGVSLDPATTAWCAAFINATLAQSGMSGTGSNMARSFLNWGEEVTQPQRGDVVVLSRGDPPFGHVGFFDGYNDDGSIRILGGNQGSQGSVSMANYSPDRVLGFRRQVNPNAGDVSSGLAELVDIADPDVRRAAIEEFNLRVSISQGQAKANRASAQDAAFQLIESGGAIDDLPLNFRQTLGREAMSELRTYQSKRNSGDQITTDPATYYQVRQMQASNPAEFRQLDLLQHVNSLDEGDFQELVKLQTAAASDIKSVAASTLMTTASRQMAAAGIDTTPDAGSTDATSVATMQTRLLRWQDQFIAENSRQPTQTEIDERIARELVPVVINPSGLYNEVEASVFQLQAMELSESRLADSSITVGDTEVPAAVINEQIIALRTAGIEVTPENLIEQIVDLFERAGLR